MGKLVWASDTTTYWNPATSPTGSVLITCPLTDAPEGWTDLGAFTVTSKDERTIYNLHAAPSGDTAKIATILNDWAKDLPDTARFTPSGGGN